MIHLEHIEKNNDLAVFFLDKRNEAFLERSSEKVRFNKLTIDKIESNEELYLLRVDNKYVAGISIEPMGKVVKLKNIWVDINDRRRGYASILIDKIEEECKKLGFEVLTLNVVSEYKPAIKLYLKKGFIKQKVFPNSQNFFYLFTMVKNLKKRGAKIFKIKTGLTFIFSKFKYSLLFRKDGKEKFLYKIIYRKKG